MNEVQENFGSDEIIRLENGIKLVPRITMVDIAEDDGGFRRNVISLRKIIRRMPAEEVKLKIEKMLSALIY